MKKRFLLSILVAIFTLSMAACGPAATSTPAPQGEEASPIAEEPTAEAASPEATATEAAAPADAEEPVTLRFWVHQNVAFEAGYQDLIDAYMAQHPNVTIQMETFEYNTYVQTLQTTLPLGEEADVLQMFGAWTNMYADRLAPVPDSVMSIDEAKDKFYMAPLGGFMYNGNLYGLPQEFNTEYGGVLVNKTMFEAADLTYPPDWKTMDDVLTIGQQLTKFDNDTMTVSGFDFSSQDPIVFWFLAGIRQRGGDYWNADHTQFTFDTPEAKATLEYMLKAVQEYKVVDPVVFNEETNWVGTAFFTGQAAIAYVGPWAVATGKTDFPDFADEYDYFTLPYEGDAPKFVTGGGWGLSVSPNSDHQDVAWDFVKFVTDNADNAVKWNIASFTLPALKEVVGRPEIEATMPFLSRLQDQLSYGEFMGHWPDRNKVTGQSIFPHIMNVLQGIETVDDALVAINNEANATFK
jgi:multiple sugar transport system substrate-binding protein